MGELFNWLLGRPSAPPPPVYPAPDTRPIPPASVQSNANPLPVVKNWSHPFKDSRHPLLQLTHLAKAMAGTYPLGFNGLWHGGVHFDGGTAGTLDQSSVHSVADGEVVAYRFDTQAPTTAYFVNKLSVNKPFSRNFVLVRHRLQPPKINGNPQQPPSLIVYSLYMHIQGWGEYQADAAQARPVYWPEGAVRHVKATANDAFPRDPERKGLNLRHQALQGTVIGSLPPGAQIKVSGTGEYRKLENVLGPHVLLDEPGALRGYLSMSFLQPVEGDEYRLLRELNVRAEANIHSASIGRLPAGTQVAVRGEGEFR
ncbi:SH3 domain-containing protein [Pseudomonas abieticivorans]|uniref:SH3 domain-containing protein n=1 Tax=Pseudomonas abieticivorans TaxID=2931382 RepID=UPI0020BFDFDF|nr:hypothetical protein [Pseudomonas sp. PIA16]